jgi:hypothetical protein
VGTALILMFATVADPCCQTNCLDINSPPVAFEIAEHAEEKQKISLFSVFSAISAVKK